MKIKLLNASIYAVAVLLLPFVYITGRVIVKLAVMAGANMVTIKDIIGCYLFGLVIAIGLFLWYSIFIETYILKIKRNEKVNR